jgi:hypothetical protein
MLDIDATHTHSSEPQGCVSGLSSCLTALASKTFQRAPQGLRGHRRTSTTTTAPIEIKTQAGTPFASGPATPMQDKYTP